MQHIENEFQLPTSEDLKNNGVSSLVQTSLNSDDFAHCTNLLFTLRANSKEEIIKQLKAGILDLNKYLDAVQQSGKKPTVEINSYPHP